MSKLKVFSVGDVIHCWTVLRLDEKRIYLCKCKCGNTQKVRAYDLNNGKSKMCRACSTTSTKTKHGRSKNDLTYTSYMHMLGRCTNPKNKDYENYGKRGITVCEAWQECFEAFLMSNGPCPGPGHTIDRIETNGNYEPGNTKWSTKTEQSRNRRNNLVIELNGETKVLSEWLEYYKVEKPNTVYKQISRGKDPKEALLDSIKK
jgi:hypothetical protein